MKWTVTTVIVGVLAALLYVRVTSPDVLTSEDLTLPQNCGVTFAIATEDQIAALEAKSLIEVVPGSFGPPAAATLPSDAWRIEFHLGQGLFEQWCTDVIESDSPRRLIERTYSAVAGSVDVPVARGFTEDSCDETEVTIVLSGLQFRSADGDEIELAGPIELSASGYGCMVG